MPRSHDRTPDAGRWTPTATGDGEWQSRARRYFTASKLPRGLFCTTARGLFTCNALAWASQVLFHPSTDPLMSFIILTWEKHIHVGLCGSGALLPSLYSSHPSRLLLPTNSKLVQIVPCLLSRLSRISAPVFSPLPSPCLLLCPLTPLSPPPVEVCP